MTKLVGALLLLAALTGCAGVAYKQARDNANQITNGMTMAEVVKILGIPPTVANSEYAYWRRGNAQEYDGTARGAIRFNFKDGRVVDVPNGGIFNPATAAEFAQKREFEKGEQAKRQREARNAAEAAYARVVADSVITCPDKQTCAKVFALAQVYVTTVSDMKIQIATDSVIETYNPTEAGRMGVKVHKLPTAGSAEQVTITPVCRDEWPAHELCKIKSENVYSGFRTYIESRLGPMGTASSATRTSI